MLPAFAACGLPTIYFRLRHPRRKALGLVLGALLSTLAVATVVEPAFESAGGATKFFADTMMLGLYAAVLVALYAATRRS